MFVYNSANSFLNSLKRAIYSKHLAVMSAGSRLIDCPSRNVYRLTLTSVTCILLIKEVPFLTLLRNMVNSSVVISMNFDTHYIFIFRLATKFMNGNYTSNYNWCLICSHLIGGLPMMTLIPHSQT